MTTQTSTMNKDNAKACLDKAVAFLDATSDKTVAQQLYTAAQRQQSQRAVRAYNGSIMKKFRSLR